MDCGNDEIYVVNLSDAKPIQLTDEIEANTQATWSPDGSLIAFVSERNRNPPNTGEIYIMNVEGSSQINLTKSQANDGFHVWGAAG